MQLNQNYKVAIFDCDGVILQSNEMKSTAFAKALEGEDPQLVKTFVEYHKSNGGVSRYVKFDHFFRNIKKQVEFDRSLASALEKYALITSQGLLTCELVPGVIDIFDYFNSKGVRCYVASGGAEGEVRYCLGELGLSRYFDGIYGSPRTKIDHLEELRANNLLGAPCVYFGDAKSDLDAAKAFGLDFVFISSYSDWENGLGYCESHGIPHICDFRALELNKI